MTLYPYKISFNNITKNQNIENIYNYISNQILPLKKQIDQLTDISYIPNLFVGKSAPKNTDGLKNGDYYLNLITGDYYIYMNSSYVLQGTILPLLFSELNSLINEVNKLNNLIQNTPSGPTSNNITIIPYSINFDVLADNAPSYTYTKIYSLGFFNSGQIINNNTNLTATIITNTPTNNQYISFVVTDNGYLNKLYVAYNINNYNGDNISSNSLNATIYLGDSSGFTATNLSVDLSSTGTFVNGNSFNSIQVTEGQYVSLIITNVLTTSSTATYGSYNISVYAGLSFTAS
jgi:hypothetical protein